MKSTLIFLGFSAFAIAHTGIKSRLAQSTTDPAPGTGSGAGAPAACTCNLPEGGAGTGLPVLASGTYSGFTQGGSLSNGLSISTVPDTQILEQGASECCACNTGSHAAEANAAKKRHFEILGDIVFNETLTWFSSGNHSSDSQGRAEKQSASAVNYVNNNNTGAGLPQCVTVCPANGTISI